MPKGLILKGFARRKSSGNILDFDTDNSAPAPAASGEKSSFRVLERPEKKTVSYGREKPATSGRTFNSPLAALRGKSVDNLTLGPNRGSAGTTNSGSSGYYESSSASARHSSTSTLPSSLDQDHRSPDDEELFPNPRKAATTGMSQTAAAYAAEPPLPPPTFSSRAARAFSFGGNKHVKSPAKDVPPLAPSHVNHINHASLRAHSPQRDRAMTASSYASTAVPTHTELKLSSPDFGSDDFGSMFESLKKDPLPSPSHAVGSLDRNVYGTTSGPSHNAYARQESAPMFPPRTLSREALSSSPNPAKINRSDSTSPYSWDDGSSNDGLVSTSALSSPTLPDGGMSGSAAAGGIGHAFLGKSQTGYARVPDRNNSPRLTNDSQEDFSVSYMASMIKDKEPAYTSRQAQVDDDDRWTRRVELRDAAPGRTQPPAPSSMLAPGSSASRGGPSSPNSSVGDLPDSNTTTPRAARTLGPLKEDSMFDHVSPARPASRAARPAAHERSASGAAKTMTKAQYQAMVRQGASSAEHSSEEEESEDDYDEEDEIERAKKLATQRRKQEANMSVYRQQMKKVTGGGPSDLPSSGASTVRPSMDRGSSTPGGIGLHFGGIGGQPPEASQRGRPDDDEDEDVPLGILQAHNFPSSARPPTRLAENDLHQRRMSTAGSVVNGGAGQGNLPPFARRLPQDPYFGAGIVNPSTRESLAMNGATASGVGMVPSAPPMMPPAGHPGGLVGVIAGEEKARAARRGSPNAAAVMGGGLPLPSNMMQPQNMQRAMSMGNIMPPTVYSPSGMSSMPQMNSMMMNGMAGMMPQMPQMPQDANQQQMQQFMAMQMQLMQNMLNMQQAQMTGQMTPSVAPSQPQLQTGDYLGVNFNGANRPQSIVSQQGFAPSNQGRSMTMTSPPSGWGSAANPSGPRPNSSLPMTGNGYSPSVHGMNMHNGPAAGYTPSIAPSERSNVGMPSRYRTVTQNGDASRTHSMTSNMTLQAFAKQQTSPNLPGTPYGSSSLQAPKSTIRVIDKPKGAPKVVSGPADDDEDEGWADMKKKREEKKKSKWSFRKDKSTAEPSLGELYQSMD